MLLFCLNSALFIVWALIVCIKSLWLRGRYCVKDNCPQLIIEASGLFTQCHVTSRVSEVSWNRRLLSVSDISHMWLICTVTALVGLSCWSGKKVHSIQSPPSIVSYFTLCTGTGLNVQKSDSSSLSLCCREKTQMIYYSFFLVHFIFISIFISFIVHRSTKTKYNIFIKKKFTFTERVYAIVNFFMPTPFLTFTTKQWVTKQKKNR